MTMMEINDIHIPFLSWLHELKVPVIYHRPDRKSGIQRGMPDFTVTWMSRVVFIEAKTPEGRLSKVQENVIRFLRAAGNRVEICRSFDECKEAVKKALLEKDLIVPGNGTEDTPDYLNAVPVLVEAAGLSDRLIDISNESGTGGEAREGTDNVGENRRPCGGVQNTLPRQPLADRNEEGQKSANFYIVQWKGLPFVVARDQEGKYRDIRQASVIDIATYPKLP